MSVYKEIDGDIGREYKLVTNGFFQKQTERALVEIVPTVEYGTAFFIDGELQLTEKDEYIYHELLVHPCLMAARIRKRVCILGGGDGCAAREVLKWPDVESIHIIDWDKEVTDLFQTKYAHLNAWSLEDKRVTIENKNIQELFHEARKYDCILVDLLDPDESKGQLWVDVLRIARSWVADGGSLGINAGGITAWQINTLNWLLQHVESTPKFKRHLYKVFVPSFGREWCFLLLNEAKTIQVTNLPSNLRYMDEIAWHQAYTYGWTKNYLENIHGLQ